MEPAASRSWWEKRSLAVSLCCFPSNLNRIPAGDRPALAVFSRFPAAEPGKYSIICQSWPESH